LNDIMAGSFAIRQSKMILARSVYASEVERSGLLTRIAAESVSLRRQMKS